ncbi:hypothetical protein RRF57_012186 [Xylaria bambusicola]|uniref:Mid2 domain-containing protein n=1 Tax=Xylaria bambusicola TaxID=326684 RepID=A0AAN7UXN8_9PEZI
MSAPFQVASIDSKGDKPTPISTSSAVGSATGPTQDPASSNTSASSSDQSAQVTSTSSKAESHSSQTSDSSEPTTSIPSSTQPGSGPSLTESVPSQQETSKNQPSSINKGLIAGIATTVVLYVVGLIGLIGFIFYYRRRVLGKMRRLICGKPDKSEIDGRFQKAEMGTQGHGVNVTRRYELDAAREIQEADSRERPAELDSNNAGLDAGAINTEDEILCTGLIAMYQEVER